ncbi:MAG: peptidyl-tRNA hydrolase Pth2 [Candidatus Bathyarchaeota archaeon]|nr:peptidyl-tRNA hydrolase Pth2 [Candidatus Bathyarchaeota archaeon]
MIVRDDLKISKGKICVQVAHAAVSAYEETRKTRLEWAEKWLNEGQRKVILKAESLKKIYEIKVRAEKLGLSVALVEDKGLTELPPGTVTCLAIGPAPLNLVNKVTGSLPLF